MAVREALIRARKAAGLTQQEVADLIGMDRASYAHIERGTRNPSYEVMTRLADLLGGSMDALFLPTDVPKRHNEHAAAAGQ